MNEYRHNSSEAIQRTQPGWDSHRILKNDSLILLTIHAYWMSQPAQNNFRLLPPKYGACITVIYQKQ